MPGQRVQRAGEQSLSSLATIYGCCGLFDLCGDGDLMSLSLEGASDFLDWIGWTGTDVCVVQRDFITYVRPAQSGGEPTDGYLGDPCAPAQSVDWGTCDFRLEDFARLRRKGPTRDVTMNDIRYCERQPRYRLDGSVITDDREYDMLVATEVIMQDLKRMVITGNAVTDGQFDGLEQLVVTGYTNSAGRNCDIMDSIVVDWNGNDMDGGAGITWNGVTRPSGYDFVDYLLAAYRQIRQRISWAPQLDAQGLNVGDIVLVLPTQAARCLLDQYTCWSVCDDGVRIDSLEARTFRNDLNGGMFGDGRIFLDGFEIPLITYDWELQKGPTTADIYMLTGQVGNVKTLMGEYNNMSTVPNRFDGYAVTDGGRLLTWVNSDETCVEQNVEMRPRIVSWAPWANVRFQDVVCRQVNDPLSPDPNATSYFPEGSFESAEC